MRTLIFIVFSIGAVIANAQKKEKPLKIEKYYDYQWHECQPDSARYYGVTIKTDSGWHRQDYYLHDFVLQMDGTYDDSVGKTANGRFYFFFPNKQVESYGYYVHGKKQGTWLDYYINGMMKDSACYQDGNEVGISLGWHQNGYEADSASWQKDGAGVRVGWFSDGSLSSAGRYVNWNTMQGKWQFFHPNGKVSAIELYDSGKLLSKQYFDESGSPVDTANRDHAPSFPGGVEAWQRYLYKKLFFPPQFKIVNADQAVIVITFTVNEQGMVEGAYVSTPFYPAFDGIALNALNHSPRWLPAVLHNRRVKYSFSQTVTFSQGDQ